MFYLIGLGADLNSVSLEGLAACKKCSRIYLEKYTVHLPYAVSDLEQVMGMKIHLLDRESVEKEMFVDEAKKKDIALLVYGSPLTATTHISLLLKCKKEKILYRVFHNASIFDSVAETGLQMYKFGKVASMPTWKVDYKPKSFMQIVRENQSIGAHSLILVDIGLSFQDALRQLKESLETPVEKIVVCSMMGTSQQQILFQPLKDLEKSKIAEPFCFIIPGTLHFLEEEMLHTYS